MLRAVSTSGWDYESRYYKMKRKAKEKTTCILIF